MRDVRLGSEAEVQQTRAGCLLLAISGPKDECQKSQTFQNRLYGKNPLESVQISLGILRISGQPQRGTVSGSFPYHPVEKRTQRVPEHCAFVGRVEVA